MSLPPIFPWWPRGPLDAPARPERIPARGPLSTGLLILATLAWVALAGSMVMAALGAFLGVAAIAGAILASATLVLLRAWSQGTYVSDSGFCVRRAWSTRSGRWSEVTSVDVGPSLVVIECSDTSIGTHVRRWSLDVLGSQEGYEEAADRLMRWYLQE